jgi:hypothetical protein
MFPANDNGVKLKKVPFARRFQPEGEDFCVDLPHGRQICASQSLFLYKQRKINHLGKVA